MPNITSLLFNINSRPAYGTGKKTNDGKTAQFIEKKMYRCTFPKMNKCLVDEVFRSYLRKFRHFVIKRIPRSQLHVLSSLRVQKTTDIGINHLTLWTFSKTCLEQCFARISRSAKKKCSGRLGTIPFQVSRFLRHFENEAGITSSKMYTLRIISQMRFI